MSTYSLLPFVPASGACSEINQTRCAFTNCKLRLTKPHVKLNCHMTLVGRGRLTRSREDVMHLSATCANGAYSISSVVRQSVIQRPKKNKNRQPSGLNFLGGTQQGRGRSTPLMFTVGRRSVSPPRSLSSKSHSFCSAGRTWTGAGS